MSRQPRMYKLQGVLGLEHKLPKVKKTAGRIGTPLPAGVSSIKPPKIAVALAVAPGLFGGRSCQTTPNEHDTHGGSDE